MGSPQSKAPAETPNNLPIRLTSFVGRREELRHARRLLHDGRLLTLTGAAGAGKSRLAIRLSETLLGEFAGGVWLVELGTLDRPDLIAPTIATQILGVPTLTGPDLVQELSGLLDRSAILLVLDNCEHLLEACAGLADRLLDGAPRLKLLITSREPLGIAGETIYTVPPLSLPNKGRDIGLPSRSDAVVLFVDRLRAHKPDFALTERNAGSVHEICRRLDGLPLALELAAAHARHLSLPDLEAQLERSSLRGAPERLADSRHPSLIHALDRSYEVLTEAERDLFLRLSVCVGGFDLDAAEALGKRPADPPLQSELVWRLVDRSLLTVAEGARGRSRYRMLEPLRQYALERLATSGGLAVAEERQARHYARVVETAAEEISASGQATWLDRLEEEHPNIRAALEWSCGHEPELALEVAAGLWFFWSIRGHNAEWMRWLQRALALGDGTGCLRGWGLAALAWLIVRGAKDLVRPDALAPAEEALVLAAACDDGALRVRALLALAHANLSVDRERGIDIFATSVAAAREQRQPALLAEALAEEATARLMGGQREGATLLATEALALARELGNQHLITSSATVLARDATYQGRPEAERTWAEALASSRELGDSERIRFCLGWVAVLAAGRRDFEAAVAALESDVDVTRAMGSVDGEIQLLDDAAIVAFHADQPAWSLRLAAGARARKESSWVESPYWAMRMAEVVAGSRNKLPVAEADKAWAEGGTLTLEAGMTAAEAMLREVDRLRVSRRHKKGALSSREVEVARLIGLGFTSRELATRLFISERTAEGHVQHILNKLGLVNRSQIAAWVTENRPAASPV